MAQEYNRTKVIIYKHHFASVNTALKQAFQEKHHVVNYVAWVKEQIYLRFGLVLESADDFEAVESMLDTAYYRSAGEWLDEQMRKALQAED